MAGSEPYTRDNLLDRISRPASLEAWYRYGEQRERELIERHLPLREGRVLSVGCGWNPGRHLFPKPRFALVGADVDAARPAAAVARGEADEAVTGAAGRLGLPDASFDAVLYRLVMHHIAYKEPLAPCFAESAALLRPGGVLVVIEPGAWHPIGAALRLANALRLGTLVHGTPDDVPLSPLRLVREARAAGLRPELHAVTFGWRRLPPAAQRVVGPLDRAGSTPGLRLFGHTLMLLARKPG